MLHLYRWPPAGVFEFALNRLNFALESSPANTRTAGLWPAHYPTWVRGACPYCENSETTHRIRLQRNSPSSLQVAPSASSDSPIQWNESGVISVNRQRVG